MVTNNLWNKLVKPVEIYPLAGFRVLFGAAMVFSTIRFMALGWIDDHYISPAFHFKYFGFSWIEAGPSWFMYAIHVLLVLASLGVMLGYQYRLAALLQFLCFTYTELIDLTYYLNHYYYVSLVSFLLIFLPANRAFSLDVKFGRKEEWKHVPHWMPLSLMWMMAIVYTYAGLAKLNTDWLIHALPLKIWLPASSDLPVLGPLFAWKWSPWMFSWLGMLYDCSIAFLLFRSSSRPWAYLSVVFFHSITGILFQIGVFPIVMMAGTLIFFSSNWHLKWMRWIQPELGKGETRNTGRPILASPATQIVLTLFFTFQVLFPWRYLLYPGNHFWTEQGYRFGWRVMLVEKAGTAHFYVADGDDGKKGLVDNRMFLNAHQEKQMSYQPDMLLQFAHHLKAHYQSKGMENPVVTAEVYVTQNGRPSTLFIDSSVNLAGLRDTWQPKSWILPYPENE